MKKETTDLDGIDDADTRAPGTGRCLWVTKLFDWKFKDGIVYCLLL